MSSALRIHPHVERPFRLKTKSARRDRRVAGCSRRGRPAFHLARRVAGSFAKFCKRSMPQLDRRPVASSAPRTVKLLRARSPALPDPYRSQSNDPVRRGVLRFRNCARPGPPSRRYRSRHAGRLKNRSLLLKEPGHGHFPLRHAHPARGCLSNPPPLDAQLVERLLILRRERCSSICLRNASRLRTSKYVRLPSTATSP